MIWILYFYIHDLDAFILSMLIIAKIFLRIGSVRVILKIITMLNSDDDNDDDYGSDSNNNKLSRDENVNSEPTTRSTTTIIITNKDISKQHYSLILMRMTLLLN